MCLVNADVKHLFVGLSMPTFAALYIIYYNFQNWSMLKNDCVFFRHAKFVKDFYNNLVP